MAGSWRPQAAAGLRRQRDRQEEHRRSDPLDFEARKPLATLRAHAERIFGLSFTSDGKTLATTGFDKEVKLWRGFQARKPAARLSAEDIDKLWKQLASADLVVRMRPSKR